MGREERALERFRTDTMTTNASVATIEGENGEFKIQLTVRRIDGSPIEKKDVQAAYTQFMSQLPQSARVGR
jgi:hypothetical protein